MHPAENEIAYLLFYRLYSAYLLREPTLKDEYEMLREHYRLHPESFSSLSKDDLQKLKQIQDDIKNDRYSLFSGTLDFSEKSVPTDICKTEERHKSLCDRIRRDKDRLFRGIIRGNLTYSAREHPTRFGPIDIVLQDDEGTAYVVEVKTERATHAIVGQMAKYFTGLSLYLILKHFLRVKMIAICPSYDEPSYNGLLQIGAVPLILKPDPLEIIIPTR